MFPVKKYLQCLKAWRHELVRRANMPLKEEQTMFFRNMHPRVLYAGKKKETSHLSEMSLGNTSPLRKR